MTRAVQGVHWIGLFFPWNIERSSENKTLFDVHPIPNTRGCDNKNIGMYQKIVEKYESERQIRERDHSTAYSVKYRNEKNIV